MTLLPPMARCRTPSSRMHQSWGAPVRSKNGLAGQTGGYLLVEVVQVAVRAGAEDRAGILLGLQQAGDDERLVPAQDRGLGFDVGPLLEPAVQALLVALLQVIPQPGQRAAGVHLGYRVQAGREVLGGRPVPRLDLADHVVRDGGPGGQVLLGQARPGPVEAQLRAEHARGRPGSVGIVRLGGCPQADEAVLVASEFATNSVLHSASRHGGAFTLRAEVHPDCLRSEVEDAGGPWRDGLRDDGRPHGFDVVAAIAGAGNWGVDGDARGRVAWARLGG